MNPLTKPRKVPASSATSGKPCAASRRRNAAKSSACAGNRNSSSFMRRFGPMLFSRMPGTSSVATVSASRRAIIAGKCRAIGFRRGRRMLAQRAFDRLGPRIGQREIREFVHSMQTFARRRAAREREDVVVGKSGFLARRHSGRLLCVDRVHEFVVVGPRVDRLRLVRFVARARRDQRTEARHPPAVTQHTPARARREFVRESVAADKRLARLDHGQRLQRNRAA